MIYDAHVRDYPTTTKFAGNKIELIVVLHLHMRIRIRMRTRKRMRMSIHDSVFRQKRSGHISNQ